MSRYSQREIVDRCLGVYALLLVLLTTVAWGVYVAEGHPALCRPFFAKTDRFHDLTNYVGKIAHLSEGGAALGRGLPTYNYPAPAAYVYAFFLRGFPQHPIRAYLIFLLAGTMTGAVLLWRAAQLNQRMRWGPAAAIVATTVLGFPMLFTADRGNLEGVVALVLAAGLVLFITHRYYGAAVFIGLAASIKPFPGLFLLLLIRKGLYRQVIVGGACAALATLLALTALGPTPWVAYKGLEPGVKRYYNNYIMTVPSPDEGRFDHSIMDGLKTAARAYLHRSDRGKPVAMMASGDSETASPASTLSPQPATHLAEAELRSAHYAQIHLLFVVSMLGGAVAFVYVLVHVFRLPVVNQMILISVAITLLPPVSAEYTLLHLYVPFGAFLLFLVRDVATGQVVFKRNRILTVLFLFAFLFSPLSFFERYSGGVKMLMLVAFLIIAGSYPMPSSIFKEVTPEAVIVPD